MGVKKHNSCWSCHLHCTLAVPATIHSSRHAPRKLNTRVCSAQSLSRPLRLLHLLSTVASLGALLVVGRKQVSAVPNKASALSYIFTSAAQSSQSPTAAAVATLIRLVTRVTHCHLLASNYYVCDARSGSARGLTEVSAHRASVRYATTSL